MLCHRFVLPQGKISGISASASETGFIWNSYHPPSFHAVRPASSHYFQQKELNIVPSEELQVTCVSLGLQSIANCRKPFALCLVEDWQMKPSDIIYAIRFAEPFTHCSNHLRNGVLSLLQCISLDPSKQAFWCQPSLMEVKANSRGCICICLLPFCIPLLLGIP